MMKKMPEKKNELREAFKTFDADGDGCTTRSELRKILIKFGQHLSDQELDAVMLEVDKNRGESISVPCGFDLFHITRIGRIQISQQNLSLLIFSHIRWSHFL